MKISYRFTNEEFSCNEGRIVAFDGRKYAGELDFERFGKDMEIMEVRVEPKYRHHGIGTKLYRMFCYDVVIPCKIRNIRGVVRAQASLKLRIKTFGKPILLRRYIDFARRHIGEKTTIAKALRELPGEHTWRTHYDKLEREPAFEILNRGRCVISKRGGRI